MLCFPLESLAPTEESLCWAHSPVGHDGSAREARPVSDKDSSVGAPVPSVKTVSRGASLRMTVIVHTRFADSV
jgi:hypothetical protein